MSSNTNFTNHSLDESLFREWFDLYFDPVCEFLNFYTRDKDLIQDVVQEIFIKLWEDRETLNIIHIKTYLYTSARNRILNQLRDTQNRMRLLEELCAEELEKNEGAHCVDKEEFYLVLQQAVDSLPSKYREIYELSRDEGLTYVQIAKEKNSSVKTIETQMSATLRHIKSHLLNYYKKIQ